MLDDAIRANTVAAARSAKGINRFSLSACTRHPVPQGTTGHFVVVHGELDAIVRREDSERLASFLQAELVEVGGSGHTIMNEASEEFAALLESLVPPDS
jgi:pimeloyl-ACP methyl ester carboxylesterase